jgi:hypothetical protein
MLDFFFNTDGKRENFLKEKVKKFWIKKRYTIKCKIRALGALPFFILALLGPDLDPATQWNPDPKH